MESLRKTPAKIQISYRMIEHARCEASVQYVLRSCSILSYDIKVPF